MRNPSGDPWYDKAMWYPSSALQRLVRHGSLLKTYLIMSFWKNSRSWGKFRICAKAWYIEKIGSGDKLTDAA
jgi:hypothetical protein